MIALHTYLPQRIFLIQGDISVYDDYVQASKNLFAIVHHVNVSRCTVEVAKDLGRFIREGDGTERIYIVFFSLFSPDATQLLLKSFEEPDVQTTVICITPYPYLIPLTIRSRVVLIQHVATHTIGTVYTKSSALAYVKSDLAKESDDDASTRKAKAVVFLDDLERQWRSDSAKVSSIYTAKHMLLHANLPTKFVAEYVVTAVFI